jgi:hypothetical protein
MSAMPVPRMVVHRDVLAAFDALHNAPLPPELELLAHLNRKQRRSLRASRGRTDQLDKTGYAWCSFATRIQRYRKARRVKLTRERAARKVTRG